MAVESYKKIFQKIAEPLAIIGKDQRYIDCNEAYADIVDLKRKDICGKYVADVLGAAVYHLIQKRLEMALKGKPQVWETWIVRNKPHHVRVSYVPISEGVVASVVDITNGNNNPYVTGSDIDRFSYKLETSPYLRRLRELVHGSG